MCGSLHVHVGSHLKTVFLSQVLTFNFKHMLLIVQTLLSKEAARSWIDDVISREPEFHLLNGGEKENKSLIIRQ